VHLLKFDSEHKPVPSEQLPGSADGASVGLMDWLWLDDFDGESVGLLTIGLVIGSQLGSFVDACVGNDVGCGDGAGVGCCGKWEQRAVHDTRI